MFWSFTLSGASFAYGSRSPVIHPYSQSGVRPFLFRGQLYTDQLVGLDSIPHLAPYFDDRGIDLALFTPDDPIAQDPFPPAPEGNSGPGRLQATRRGYAEVLVYLPNPADGELSGGDKTSAESVTRIRAALKLTRTPNVDIDLSQAPGASYDLTWFRPSDGATQAGGEVTGGAVVQVTSPWTGSDAVARLLATTDPGVQPTLDPIGTQVAQVGQLLQFVVTGNDPDGLVVVFRAEGLPYGATFTDNGDDTATFQWTPDATEVGPHTVKFFAGDALNPDFAGIENVTVTAN